MDDLEVSDMEQRNIIGLGKVYTSKSIPANMENIVTQDDIKSWPYLKKVKLNRVPHGDNVHIGILIGNNVPRAYEPLDVINSEDDGPFACRSLLGWTVHGVPKATPSCTTGISAYRTQVNIEDQIVKLYNQDFQESLHDETPERSLNDKRFLANVEETIKFTKHGHYEIGLPLNNKEVKFPDNKTQAEVRVAHLRRKLLKMPVIL